MNAKERHTLKLLEYLSNPDSDNFKRITFSVNVLGLANDTQIYKYFTPSELSEIEKEALEIRRTKYSLQLCKVDNALLRLASEGDTAAARLCYQRFEGWSEKKEINANINATIEMEAKIRAEVESDLLGKKVKEIGTSGHAEGLLTKGT